MTGTLVHLLISSTSPSPPGGIPQGLSFSLSKERYISPLITFNQPLWLVILCTIEPEEPYCLVLLKLLVEGATRGKQEE